MQNYSTQFRVVDKHLDECAHMNWMQYYVVATCFHFVLRDSLNLGIESLQRDHGFLLVMREQQGAWYKQLRKDDLVESEIEMWIEGRTCLKFRCRFKLDCTLVAELSWLMPLVSVTTERPCRIPPWMIQVIKTDKPEGIKPRKFPIPIPAIAGV